MRYVKPLFYDQFSCTADRCPDTCCAGWQIMIDEDSLEKYGAVKGSFGNRLRNSIDWEEGCFYQYDRRCAFLNEKNLCDLYLALGEDGFCDTCRRYPRHTEEFEGLREESLSLSCPVAARLILKQQGMLSFIVEEDDEEDELEEEFEDFDLMLFTLLEDARNAVFEKLECAAGGSEKLQDVMDSSLLLAEHMQASVEEGSYFEIEDLIGEYRENLIWEYRENLIGEHRENLTENGDAEFRSGSGDNCTDVSAEKYENRTRLFETINKLERLRDEWSDVLNELEQTLYAGGAESYRDICAEFEAYLDQDAERRGQYENIGLQLFIFFAYTYFCGAVYDGWVYSKMALAVRSVEFIRELFMARWKKTGKLDFEDYVELSYRYAREIEHSDQNLDELEEAFMSEIEELD